MLNEHKIVIEESLFKV